MSALSSQALQLLDFLCDLHSRRIRVKSLKRFSDAARRDQLQEAKLVFAGTCEPTPWALHEWQQRRQQTPAEASVAEPTLPPAPRADAEGGGADARYADAPPPIDLDRLLECFGDEFETLRAVAARFGVHSPQKIVRHARTLHERGLIDQQPPTTGRPFLLWRKSKVPGPLAMPASELAGLPAEVIAELSKPAQAQIEKAKKRNTKGASGTARKASGASSSGDASRIEDRAPIHEPASALAPSARAHPVDIKVNIGPRRDPTKAPETPLMDLRERQSAAAYKRIASIRRGQETEASARLDAGLGGRNSVEKNLMIALRRRREDEARLTDPVEQAKTIIRRKGYVCFAAHVSLGEEGLGKFFIGTRLVEKAELLAYAGRLAA